MTEESLTLTRLSLRSQRCDTASSFFTSLHHSVIVVHTLLVIVLRRRRPHICGVASTKSSAQPGRNKHGPGCQYPAMSASAIWTAYEILSSFIYSRPDVDGPPPSIPDIAKQKLLCITQHLPGPTSHIQDQQHRLALLTDSPGYAVFFLTSLDLYERLLNAKPVLIQGTFFFCKVLDLKVCILHVLQNVSQMTRGNFLLL
jgi:hypothetical protein